MKITNASKFWNNVAATDGNWKYSDKTLI